MPYYNRVVCAQSIRWKTVCRRSTCKLWKKTATETTDDGMNERKKTTSHCIIYIHMGDVIRIEFRPKTNCRKSYKTWSMAHSHIRTSHHFGRMNQNRKKERTKKQKKKWCEKKAKTNKKNVRAITLLHNVLVICLLIFPFLRAIADRYIRC